MKEWIKNNNNLSQNRLCLTFYPISFIFLGIFHSADWWNCNYTVWRKGTILEGYRKYGKKIEQDIGRTTEEEEESLN